MAKKIPRTLGDGGGSSVPVPPVPCAGSSREPQHGRQRQAASEGKAQSTRGPKAGRQPQGGEVITAAFKGTAGYSEEKKRQLLSLITTH